MIKKIFKYFLVFLIILLVPIFYLNYLGIKTAKFNRIIEDKIKDYNPRLDINLKEVSIFLDLKNISIKLKTPKPIIIIDKIKQIELDEISSNISIRSYLFNEFSITKLELYTQDNEIKNILNFYRLINNSPQLIILNQFLNKGRVRFSVNLNFDKNGKIKKDFIISGKINNLNFNIPKYKNIDNINLDFEIYNKNYNFKNIKLNLDNIIFKSDKISINKKEKKYLVEGSINNNDNKINKKFIKLFFKSKLDQFNFNESIFLQNQTFHLKLIINLKFLN